MVVSNQNLFVFFALFFPYFRHIDQNKRRYIDVLKEAVAIKSVSAWPETRNDIVKMVDWTAERLKALGGTVELADVGEQELHDGRKLKLPPVILGVLGKVSEF